MTVPGGDAAAVVAIVVDDYALAALPGLERDLATTGAMIMRSFRGLPNPNLLRRYRGAAVVGAPDRLGLVARLERAAASVAAPVIGVLPVGVKAGPELRGPGVVDIIPAGTPRAAERVVLMSRVPTVSGGRRAAPAGAAGQVSSGTARDRPTRGSRAAQREPTGDANELGAPALAIASSTGGVWIVSDLLRALARDRPVFLAQHMEAEFVPFFADWLAEVSGWSTAVVESPMRFSAGTVYLAPGGCDLVVEGPRVHPAPAATRYVPSGDRLLRSAATALAPRLVGLVLSGMGSDGAQGLLELARLGGRALCQAPASAVVPSMPESALRCVPAAEVVRAEDLALTIRRQGNAP